MKFLLKLSLKATLVNHDLAGWDILIRIIMGSHLDDGAYHMPGSVLSVIELLHPQNNSRINTVIVTIL